MSFSPTRLFALGLLLSASPIGAATYYVSNSGSNGNPCAEAQSPGSAKRTIGGPDGGTSCLRSGDTLIIRAGTYTNQANISSNYVPSGSPGAPTIIRAETINPCDTTQCSPTVELAPSPAEAAGSCCVVFLADRDYVTIQGLRLNARKQYMQPAYIYSDSFTDMSTGMVIEDSVLENGECPGLCDASGLDSHHTDGLTVRRSHILNNGHEYHTHGVYLSNLSLNSLIEDNLFEGNSGWGTQIYCPADNCDNVIHRRNVYRNGGSASGPSGGILMWGGTNHKTYNNVFYGNVIGLRIGGQDGRCQNCLIANNTMADDIMISDPLSATNALTFANNIRAAFTDYDGGHRETSSLDYNTLRGGGSFINPSAGDFRLQSHSPARDAGADLSSIFTTDMQGNSRQPGAWDVGAYEFGSGAPLPVNCSGDQTNPHYGCQNRQCVPINGCGFTDCSACTGDPEPPPSLPAPTNLTAHCDPSGTWAIVSWDPVAGAANYYLRMDDTIDPFGGPYDVALDAHPATYAAVSVIPGHYNSWWVHGARSASDIGPHNASGFTCEAPVTTLPPLSEPQNLTVYCDPSGTWAWLNWDAVAGAANYYVRMDDTTDPPFGGPYDLAVDGHPATGLAVSVVPGHFNTWWVHGARSLSDIGPHNASGFTCEAPVVSLPPLAAPTNLTAQCDPSGTWAWISWDPVAGAANYYFRMDDTTDPVFGGPYDVAVDAHPATAIAVSVIAGHFNTWWVHGARSASDIGSHEASSFACENSLFQQAIMTQAATNGQAVQIYPNPWRADRHQGVPITFAHLAAQAKVQIFSVSGHLVRELTAGAGSAAWDRRTDTGDQAASGIYLYVITTSDGQRIRGKLAIIR